VTRLHHRHLARLGRSFTDRSHEAVTYKTHTSHDYQQVLIQLV